jgi:hypothetical protein
MVERLLSDRRRTQIDKLLHMSPMTEDSMDDRLKILDSWDDPKGMVFPDPEDPTEMIDRRQFLALAGASAALAGVFGCSPTPAARNEIVPYVRPPEGMTPGTPLTFATALGLGGAAVGLLVTSREGRPIKVEGNPDHPGSLGASDLFSQAALLGLYDPDRSKAVLHRGVPSTWEAANFALKSNLEKQRAKQGAGLRILSGATISPTLSAQRQELLRQYPQARWVRYEPVGEEAALRGSILAFGEAVHPVYDFSKADVVLSLDADFLSCEPGTVRYQREYADRRRVRSGGLGGVGADGMNRLYAVECMFTTTGANADHRLALRVSDVESFTLALAAELKVAGSPRGGPLPDNARAWLAPLAHDLLAHKGRSLVVVGDGQPASVHALGQVMNVHLDNIGKTVRLIEPLDSVGDSGIESLRSLVLEIASGKVDWLVVLGSNPVYSAPADLGFSSALKKVQTTIHLGLYSDETAAACEWHLPEAHLFESWGDAQGFDGTATIQQPLIEPLYGGRSAIDKIFGDER